MNEPTLKETIAAFVALALAFAMWWGAAWLMHMGVL